MTKKYLNNYNHYLDIIEHSNRINIIEQNTYDDKYQFIVENDLGDMVVVQLINLFYDGNIQIDDIGTGY